MLFRILRRILRRHLALHLLIPLCAGIVTYIIIAWFRTRSTSAALRSLLSIETAGLFAGILLAYLIVMYHVTKRETSVTLSGIDLARLEDSLDGARRYFATSAIRMIEWFDPVAQLFFAHIIKRKLGGGVLQDRRVLIVGDGRDRTDLEVGYSDGYYARRLAEIHHQYGTPLAFIGKAALRELLATLSPTDRETVGANPSWLPRWLKVRIPARWLVVRRQYLDFAIIEKEPGRRLVIRVTKSEERVGVTVLEGHEKQVYLTLGDLVDAKVSTQGDVTLKKEHDFQNVLFPP